MLATFPQGDHITQKRGVYHYRRRIPAPYSGELTLSLGTRRYREAEHRAAILDRAFDEAKMQVMGMTLGLAEVRRVVREHLRQALETDLEWRTSKRRGEPLYTLAAPDLDDSATDLDLDVLDYLISNAREALSERDFHSVRSTLDALMEEHGLPAEQRNFLALGLLEANLKFLEEAKRRTLGTAPMVLVDEPLEASPQPPSPLPLGPSPAVEVTGSLPPTPRFSTQVQDFAAWREKSGVRGHTVAQDRPTLRFFQELAGDKPVDSYTRADVALFLSRMQELPANYGKSPADRDRSAAEIIARAKATGAKRVAPKTAKRHLSVLSRFFKFCLDQGLISKAVRDELTEEHEFAGGAAPARQQRDAWKPEELQALFGSPVWTGCHPFFRSQRGTAVIRDAKFWLPLLALFHGCRLEEFADLYRQDLDREGAIWFVRITDTERGLKNDNAKRVVPLHPEIIRLGFLAYVERLAPNPGDPLFPDIEPQGADRKRGPRITRWFVNYRKEIRTLPRGRGDARLPAHRQYSPTRPNQQPPAGTPCRLSPWPLARRRRGARAIRQGTGLKEVADTLGLLGIPRAGPIAPLRQPRGPGHTPGSLTAARMAASRFSARVSTARSSAWPIWRSTRPRLAGYLCISVTST